MKERIKKRLAVMISNLGSQVLIAMAAGIVAGALLGSSASIFAPLGTIFISLIKMLVIPLVAVSIISGAASMGGTKAAGKIGFLTFLYYAGTTAVAVTFGLILGAVFKPGAGVDFQTVQTMFSYEFAAKGDAPGFWGTIQGIVPENIFKSLVDGNIMHVLLFSLFLGFGISTLKKDRKEFLVKNFDYLTESLIWMIEIVMLTAPIGVFGLMADAVGTFGYGILGLVIKLFLVYSLALILHSYGFFSLTLKLFSSISVKHFYSKMIKAQVVAFSTASSMATLPVNFEVCEEELGVSKETAAFVLPLGATVNMNGNAIYFALAAMFFAQLFGIDLGFSQYIAIIVTATAGSIGQAGVPGPSLLVVAVLVAADIPVAGLPLLFAVDRLFDMMRTVVNITGDSACAVIVDDMVNAVKSK
ncbi:MAG: dicarboxylate/amino acid:cation symporter [bacterium]|nr:dicarboxylate/amino acid:cation symporter [bacterium]